MIRTARAADGALHGPRALGVSYAAGATGPVDKTQLTQVGRALERLGIEHIPAYSPQARGRSERLNRTFQDRLVNELRVAKVTTLVGGQSLSARSLRPRVQRDVQLRAGRSGECVRRRSAAIDLEQILCHQEERVVGTRQHRDL